MKSHAKLTVGAAFIAGLLTISFTPTLAQQTAKVCEAQWKSNKTSIQAKGTKKKDFIAECRGLNPTASAPAKSAPAKTSSVNSAKVCEEQWKANKSTIQASGKTRKVFIGECRTSSIPAAAPPKPAPTAATPPSESKPRAQPTTTTTSAPAGVNQYSTEVAAKLRCPADTVVWLNLNSGIYHFSGRKAYGTTKRGAYMCEKDTRSAGFRAAKNEKHP